jgi:hypothetical protein
MIIGVGNEEREPVSILVAPCGFGIPSAFAAFLDLDGTDD